MKLDKNAFLNFLSDQDFYTEKLRPRWSQIPGQKVQNLENMLYAEANYRLQNYDSKHSLNAPDLGKYYIDVFKDLVEEKEIPEFEAFCKRILMFASNTNNDEEVCGDSIFLLHRLRSKKLDSLGKSKTFFLLRNTNIMKQSLIEFFLP